MDDINIMDILKKRERVDKNNKRCKINNINKKIRNTRNQTKDEWFNMQTSKKVRA